MALVDTIFSSIPSPLISQFGVDATYIKASSNPTYDPATGTVSGATTEIPIKIVIAELKPEELQGLYQITDVKIIFAAAALGDYYPQNSDSIRYSQSGVAKTVKVLPMKSYRGDNAIMHIVVGRAG